MGSSNIQISIYSHFCAGWSHLNLLTDLSLILNILSEHLYPVGSSWNFPENDKNPWNRCEYSKWTHSGLKQLECEMLLLVFHHIEGLPKRKVAHDIKAIEIEPETSVDGLALKTLQLCNQLVNKFGNTMSVLSQRYRDVSMECKIKKVSKPLMLNAPSQSFRRLLCVARSRVVCRDGLGPAITSYHADFIHLD